MKKLLTLLLLLPVLAYAQTDVEEIVALAEQGNPISQYNLGVMYASGNGVPKNSAEAVKWYRKAAEQGHIEAQINLGVRYGNGVGVQKNIFEAVKWFQLAAAQGDARAQKSLGDIYFYGRAIKEDSIRAYVWLYVAAAQGNTRAITNRDTAANDLTPEQLANSQELATKCIDSRYQDCPF